MVKEEISILADMAHMDELQAHLRLAAAGAKLPRACLLRAELVLEELFTNTVLHGYLAPQTRLSEDTVGYVWLNFDAINEQLHVRYRDAATAYNPLVFAENFLQNIANLGSALERPVGGLGCVLMAKLSDASRYAFEDGCNVLYLSFYKRSTE